MKQYITHVAVALCCLLGTTSCYEVIEYGTPNRTQYGADMFTQVQSSLYDACNYMTMISRLDDWANASTTDEQYKVEDTYFANYKIRQSGDTITLQEVGDYNLRTLVVYTNGTTIMDDGATWQLLVDNDTLTIAKDGDRRWQLSCNNLKGDNYNLYLTQGVSSLSTPSYTLTGAGYRVAFGFGCQEIAYRIDAALTLCTSTTILTSGTMVMEADELANNDEVIVHVNEDGSYEVIYRGITEIYTENAYFMY